MNAQKWREELGQVVREGVMSPEFANYPAVPQNPRLTTPHCHNTNRGGGVQLGYHRGQQPCNRATTLIGGD